jgi:hypothetical protein
MRCRRNRTKLAADGARFGLPAKNANGINQSKRPNFLRAASEIQLS